MTLETRPRAPVRWWLICLLAPVYGVLPLASALGVRVVGLEAFESNGPSMEPTLLDGDRFVLDKSAFGLSLPFLEDAVRTWATPDVGDVVVVRSPADGVDIIKRVIGVPGDRIAIVAGSVVRNGVPVEARPLEGAELALAEERIGDRTWRVTSSDPTYEESMDEVVVPPGHVFVLGDHRDRSNDSRNPRVGMIPRSRIRGRVLRVYWSRGERGIRWDRIGMEVR